MTTTSDQDQDQDEGRLERLREQYAQVMMSQGNLQADLAAATAERDRYAGELAQVRAALNEVSVYEGLVDVSPVAMMVSQLAHDHEELEARIDAVMHYLSGERQQEHAKGLVDEVSRLLRGGKRIPDTPQGL